MTGLTRDEAREQRIREHYTKHHANCNTHRGKDCECYVTTNQRYADVNYLLAREEAERARAAPFEALILEDTPDLRHWLGSQDVIGTKTTRQIAHAIHALMWFQAGGASEEPA